MQLFPTKYDKILEKVDLIQPIKYASTRNYKNGNVTKLSPYISRGVISTRFIYEKLVENGINLKKCEKFIQELAWRDFWQQIWVSKGPLINKDLKRPQEDVNDFKISKSLVEAQTGINCVDDEIRISMRMDICIIICVCMLHRLPQILLKVIGDYQQDGCITTY